MGDAYTGFIILLYLFCVSKFALYLKCLEQFSLLLIHPSGDIIFISNQRGSNKWATLHPHSFFLFSFVFFRAAPVAYGDSQARGGISAVATGLYQNHSNSRSELCLRPIPQLTQCQILNPLSKARDFVLEKKARLLPQRLESK